MTHRWKPRSVRRAVAVALLSAIAIAAAPISGAALGRHAHRSRRVRQQPDSTAITPELVSAGRAIFHGKGTCFACHGPNLEGTSVAPTLKTHAWRDAKNGELANIFYVATHGVPGTIMVAFPGGISKTEAVAVVSYVWSVGQGKVKP
jgi:mono/diheme cytochrome c family protein